MSQNAKRRQPRRFGSNVSLRTKLLLLTLIPLVPLAAWNVYGLVHMAELHEADVQHRIEQLANLWRGRVGTLVTRSAEAAHTLAAEKDVEQALRRNHWAAGREIVLRTARAEPDLRALLIDADGRLLADSRSARFDTPLASDRFVADALAGTRRTGLTTLDGAPFFGVLEPVRVVGAVEGAVWVGVHLDDALTERFGAQSQAAVIVAPPDAPPASSLDPAPPLPEGLTPFDTPTDGAGRRFRMAPVRLELPGVSGGIASWIGVDHSDVDEAVGRQLRTQGGFFAALVAIILVVTLVLSSRIVQALGFVVEKMRHLREGEYQKIDPVRGRDEIAFLGHGFNEMIKGLIERDFVRATFGRYMSADVARQILDDPDGLDMGGEGRTVTILLCDLRGFTSFSGTHRPEEVVRVLNIWLGRMSQVIEAYGGTINEFLGDAILALFGAPRGKEDDALRAVACCIAMQRAMDEVNARLADEGHPPLHMGIGLATGHVVAGNIGSETRTKYGVVGQPVNLASRVESFTVGGDVLIAQSTLDAVHSFAADAVETGPARDVQVKGSDQPLRIHPVLAVGAPHDLRLPAADAPEDERRALPETTRARVWVIRGKAMDDPLELPAYELGAHSVQVGGDGELPSWTDVRLQLVTASGAGTGDQLYGKIVESDDARALIRLTRVSPEDRTTLDAILTR